MQNPSPAPNSTHQLHKEVSHAGVRGPVEENGLELLTEVLVQEVEVIYPVEDGVDVLLLDDRLGHSGPSQKWLPVIL